MANGGNTQETKMVVMRYKGVNIGNTTLTIVGGKDLERAYTVGNNETNRDFEATEADAKILADAGLAEQIQQEQRGEVSDEQAAQDERQDVHSAFMQRFGVNQAQANALIEAGYSTPDALRQAKDEDLAKVDGIGDATVRKIRSTVGKP